MIRDKQASQTFVLLAMGVVSATLAVAMYHHGGLPGPVAATVALASYVLFFSLHALVARERSEARELKDRREQELQRIKAEALASRTLSQKGSPVAPPVIPKTPAAADLQKAAPPARPAAAPALATAPAPTPRAERATDGLATHPLAASTPPQYTTASAALPSRPAAPRSEPAAARAPQPAPEETGSFWAYRPAAQRTELPPFVTGRASARPAEPELPAARAAADTAPSQASPREADVEVIQDAIKRLLEEVNSAERKEAIPAARTEQHIASQTAAIEQSLDALRMTADTMRAAAERSATSQARMPQAAPPPLPAYATAMAAASQPVWGDAQPASPSQARARLLSDAISAGRLDVMLEPILGLEDQGTRHYEVSVRLRDVDGRPMSVFDQGPDLRGTGLLPLFDSVSIARVAAIARRLDERGKGGSLFSALSGESVADDRFVGELAETLHQRAALATQLVLSFSQADVRDFSTPEWDSIADMRALGFRFAITGITDLDMDFEALADQGFAFVKLEASVFLDGLPAPNGRIPSADVCRHLAKEGLTLVVERIESEEQRARVFGFGVLLGQGQLFGGPRPVRADVVAANAAA